ncbi:MAG: AIR synthase-related protein, partial [Candidatus Cloacimonetes bacterium]|nr:AIR synthase-related protein [Candidatus Cloacimonadota bacterium]
TGGGISGNLKRILPPGISAEIDFSKHIIPPIFHIIRKGGKISEQVMRQTFNLGIGMICVMSQDLATKFMIEQRALYLGELVGGLALPEVRFK